METFDLEDLLAQYRNGDMDALGRIVEQTRRPLYRFILGMVHDPHRADDVFQDVWLRAVRGLHRYHSRNLISWLFRIAKNRVIDLSRKRKADVSLQQPVGSSEGAAALEQFVAQPGPGPERTTGNRELAERIRRAVDALPDEQREVYLLRTEAELPFKEIALHQEVSINTALARMQYALRKLREELADDYANIQTLSRTS
jgi:RNA polymerase sigma-70 factor (ECF subfamily)